MGSVVISVDAELGWGFHDFPTPPAHRIESSREGWKTLQSLLDAHEIPATWAVVGHLLLETCDGRHDDHPAPEGWFECERTDWAGRPELRFGSDLVRSIRESPVLHEIGCHTFSHVRFDDPETTTEIARAECARSLELAARWGLEFDSFVFPRNGVGHRDVLAEQGFTVYRGRTTTPPGPRGVFDVLVRGRSPLVQPEIDEYGLVNLPASTFCFAFEGPLRTVCQSLWDDPIVALCRKSIDEAAAGDGIFHLWLHPNNLVSDREIDRMRVILSYLAECRDETELCVETMGAVGRRVNGQARVRTSYRPRAVDVHER